MSLGARRRALIVKFGAIGDVVMAIPAAFLLHQQGFAIDWICGEEVAPVLGLYPWIQPLVADYRTLMTGGMAGRFSVLLSLWRLTWLRHYDLCATLYYDSRYRLITLPVHARRKLILSPTNRDRQLLPGRHHTNEYARILLGWPDEQRPHSLAPIPVERLETTPRPPQTDHPRIILVPGGARNMLRDDDLRRWPAENYVALARALVASEYEVILVGGPGDRWSISLFHEVAVTNLIGQLSLVETIRLMDTADVTVTHDTGPLHLAGITHSGIVAIFGPTDPHSRLPQRPGAVALWGGEHFACRPCYDGRDYAPCRHNGCVREVSVAMVSREIEAILAQRRQGAVTPTRVLSVASMDAALRSSL